MSPDEEQTLELLLKKRAEEAATTTMITPSGIKITGGKDPIPDSAFAPGGRSHRDEARAPAPILQLLPGGGEKSVIVAKLEEFTAMARRGEVFDFAVALVLHPQQDGTQQMRFAWGSQIPTMQIVGAAVALQFHLCRSMPTTA